MKKLTLFLVIIFLSFCKKTTKTENPDPTACFTPGDSFIGINEVINFKNCSSNYDRVEWDFGDGQSSIISEPSHKWDTKGTYNVSLTAYKNNNSNKVSAIVHAGQIAVGNLTYNVNNIPSKYNYINVWAKLFRSNAMYGDTYQQFGYNSAGGNLSSGIKGTGTYTITDNFTTYKIKLMFFCQVSSTMDRDTVITDEIKILSGPVTPTAAINGTLVSTSYTLGPLTYK